MGGVVGELDENGVERLDQHVDGEGAGHRGKAERQAGQRIASDGEEGDAREREQDQIAGVGGDAREDADEGEDVAERPGRGHRHELADQCGDQARGLRDTGADHRRDHQADRGEAHEIRDQRLVHEADAVRVEQIADAGGRDLDLVGDRIDALVADRRAEHAEHGGKHDDDRDQDQEDDDRMGNHVPHALDSVEESLHHGL